jgi:peptidoglycan/xylan/chitin deacetylase (PgdA/CDA1 family)
VSRRQQFNRRDFLQQSAAVLAALDLGQGSGLEPNLGFASPAPIQPIPDKVVVLTFDDAVKSHRTFVAPLLEDLGFRATFFVTHKWMNDPEHFMTWQEIAEIHRMGFEIGNHTWTHDGFASPHNAARLDGELALVERELAKVGVPRPSTYAHTGDEFGPEALSVLMRQGYQLARRGMQPEVPYGEVQVGPTFDPQRNHPLLIPTTGDSYPDWTVAHFQKVVSMARSGRAVVLQFHGVPDVVHPWVFTPPEDFRQYMGFLKENAFRVLALGDLRQYINFQQPPDDPLLTARYPEAKYGCLDLPVEVLATRADLRFWLENMLLDHRYSLAEAAAVCNMSEEEVRKHAEEFGLYPSPLAPPVGKLLRLLPYPGGRHPRIGFQEGAIDPLRGTKASVFLPWEPTSYVVVDLPEAIFSNQGLLFLAHTDIPTIWNDQNVVLQNVDWKRGADGSLSFQQTLPNAVVFGASIRPAERHVDMELWLRNFSGTDLSGPKGPGGMPAQVCVMLKGAPGFNGQTNDNKLFRPPVAAVRASQGNRWILTGWQNCGRAWGNARVPCLHADPKLPDCPFAKTVRIRGRLWFYEGNDIEGELAQRGREFPPTSE